MPLSVIIPTLNEAATLPRLLAQLQAQREIELEIMVSDGDSSDGTRDLAVAAQARVIRGSRGRGAQMNAGARAARNEWLLFLHADSELHSPVLLAEALDAMRGASDCAGHFPLRFVRSQPGHDFFYRFLESKTRLNRPGTVHGDQGLLIHRRYFDALGSFDESLPFFEDARLSRRIEQTGGWRLLPGELHTSARRFETEGPRARYTLMALMMTFHAIGAPEFLQQAPQLYRAQPEATRLALRPFVQLAQTVLARRGRWRSLWDAGLYARQNLWQCALRRALLRNEDVAARLADYDRVIAPRLFNPLAGTVAALALGLWLYLLLPLRLRFKE